MNNFFSTIHGVLKDKETLSLQVTRDGTSLKVIVQPLLDGGRAKDEDDDDDDLPDDAAQVRAALAMPMRLVMAPGELDQVFGTRLADYSEPRAVLHDAFGSLMETLKDAAKSAKNSVAKKAEKPAVGKKPEAPKAKAEAKEADDADKAADSASATAAVTSSAPATPTAGNPMSLF